MYFGIAAGSQYISASRRHGIDLSLSPVSRYVRDITARRCLDITASRYLGISVSVRFDNCLQACFDYRYLDISVAPYLDKSVSLCFSFAIYQDRIISISQRSASYLSILVYHGILVSQELGVSIYRHRRFSTSVYLSTSPY